MTIHFWYLLRLAELKEMLRVNPDACSLVLYDPEEFHYSPLVRAKKEGLPAPTATSTVVMHSPLPSLPACAGVYSAGVCDMSLPLHRVLTAW